MCSVFAIHGLGGDKFRTWTDNGRLWLRDLLPTQLPEARIFTYGYGSTVAFSKSSAEVDDFARDFLHRANSARQSSTEQKRPMVFICHSLGGILFKQVGQTAYCCASSLKSPSKLWFSPITIATIDIYSTGSTVWFLWALHMEAQTSLSGVHTPETLSMRSVLEPEPTKTF
jgi:hypothetical protein